jgi:hypothetical protein
VSETYTWAYEAGPVARLEEPLHQHLPAPALPQTLYLAALLELGNRMAGNYLMEGDEPARPGQSRLDQKLGGEPRVRNVFILQRVDPKHSATSAEEPSKESASRGLEVKARSHHKTLTLGQSMPLPLERRQEALLEILARVVWGEGRRIHTRKIGLCEAPVRSETVRLVTRTGLLAAGLGLAPLRLGVEASALAASGRASRLSALRSKVESLELRDHTLKRHCTVLTLTAALCG